LHQQRWDEAAQARRWANHAVDYALLNRARAALGNLLIAFGERVRPHIAVNATRWS
jgi:hypothetical protein